MENKARDPSILIDIKRSRVRIHKQTLYMLGMPDYIELLVNPDRLLIAIRASKLRTSIAHKINWNKLCSKNSFEIFSKCFIMRLTEICASINSERSYRLIGNYCSCENIVYFDLTKAFTVSGERL